MNVRFRVGDDAVSGWFVEKGKEEEMVGLGGDGCVGGCRGCIYNGV